MFSVVPNIVLVPNMTQNAERKHRTQDANTAPIRPLHLVANFTLWRQMPFKATSLALCPSSFLGSLYEKIL